MEAGLNVFVRLQHPNCETPTHDTAEYPTLTYLSNASFMAKGMLVTKMKGHDI